LRDENKWVIFSTVTRKLLEVSVEFLQYVDIAIIKLAIEDLTRTEKRSVNEHINQIYNIKHE